jgi:carbonic anhydrase
MELHVVFYKQEYKNLTNAVKKADGLAVLSFFFEISNSPNSAYTEMSRLLPTIKKTNSSATFVKPLSLQSFMVSNIHQYYVYNGSLTTPPCSEVVTWLDFYDPIKISQEQFHNFWELEDHKGQPISFNFRPTQPIGDRVVWYTTKAFNLNADDDVFNLNDLYDGVFGSKINPARDQETEKLIFSRTDTE